MKVKAKPFKIVAMVLELLLLLFLVLVLASNLYVVCIRAITGEEHPTVAGISWAVVLSGSMEPEVGLDDLIINVAQDSYQVGDIITFDDGTKLTTHRIIRETAEGFITMGDANNTEDANPVKPEQIVGKVCVNIPNVGLFIGFLRTPMGLICLVLLGLLVIEIDHQAEKKARQDAIKAEKTRELEQARRAEMNRRKNLQGGSQVCKTYPTNQNRRNSNYLPMQ